jgi:hypothetical protein
MKVNACRPGMLPRREFLRVTSAAAAGVAFAEPSGAFSAEPPAPPRKTIGIQIGAVSFHDEGTDRVLDLLQEKAAVNTLFLTTFTHGRGLAGRQIPGHPFPDHGPQASDEAFFHGGNYATPHPEFYRDTLLKETRAPDFGSDDVLAAVLPEARKRGLSVFCSIQGDNLAAAGRAVRDSQA